MPLGEAETYRPKSRLTRRCVLQETLLARLSNRLTPRGGVTPVCWATRGDVTGIVIAGRICLLSEEGRRVADGCLGKP